MRVINNEIKQEFIAFLSICMLQDVQNKLRDSYKKTGDEFLISQIALHGKVGKSYIKYHDM